MCQSSSATDPQPFAARDAVGEQELSGLALLVGNEQPVNVPGVGPVLATGKLATLLAGSAVPSSQGSDDMQALLEGYGIPADTAARYCSALSGTGVLVWVRTEDERVGEVADVEDMLRAAQKKWLHGEAR